jgi:L-seryl-tRNA(Ser) seleniumtransferase/D-glucosaminate-6-phosphate ammonia-lyase
MKVGKEQIAGLVEGLDQYDEKDPAKAATRNNDLAEWLVDSINRIPGLHAEKVRDEAGRAIWRCRVRVEPASGKTADEVNAELRAGDPIVWARTEFLNLGMIDLDPRPLVEGDKELVIEKLSQIMEA